MANPFEDQDALFLALVNEHAQTSLWPAFLAVPAGWRTMAGPDARDKIIAALSAEPPIAPAAQPLIALPAEQTA